jgi:uncharacterized surface protein with fasciclin (FAS1) repeats
MKLFLPLLSASILTQSVSFADSDANWRGQSVTEFAAEENEKFGWVIVNDGVMGGLSEGSKEITDGGTMNFRGDLSTKNNGGFSMVTSQKLDYNLSNDLGLLLHVRGDGRTYTARLVSDARFRGMEVSFSADFATKEGEWVQVKVPFSDFKGSFRGMDLPDEKFDPANIQRIGILIGDKKNAPFDLEIDWIRTYGKGQGRFTEKTGDPAESKKSETPQRIIATAVSDGRFTTLKTALDAAVLTPFFQWDNPLTVFAPTDEAFAKLPKGMVEDLLKPENKEKLVAILSYHVVVGSTDLSDALKAKSADTIQGESLTFAFTDGRLRVNDATMIDGDVACLDGLIHVIDSVLLPPSMRPVEAK